MRVLRIEIMGIPRSLSPELLAEAKLYLALTELKNLPRDVTVKDTEKAMEVLESAIKENSFSYLLEEAKFYLALKKLRILPADATAEDKKKAIETLQSAIKEAESKGIDTSEGRRMLDEMKMQ